MNRRGFACRGSGRVAAGVAVVAALTSCGGQSSSHSGSNGGQATTGGASGTSSTGGAAPTGGAAGSAGGASAGAAGSTGSASAGATGRPVNTDPECAEIQSNMPCELEGKECPAVACGLADAGRRDCVCATTWTCTPCDSVRPMPPDIDIPLCPNDVAPGGPCFTEFSVCGPLDDGEYCACYRGDAGLIWDCAAPPSTWPQ